MTIDIGKLETGPELDALVAEKVMGWTRFDVTPTPRRNQTITNPGVAGPWYLPPGWELNECVTLGSHRLAVPKYSTDIAAAWEVVEKLRLSVSPTSDGWRGSAQSNEVDGDTATAETAPLAICRAALKAVGYSSHVVGQ